MLGERKLCYPGGMLPETAWPTPVTKTGEEEVKLYFEKGELKKVNDQDFKHTVDELVPELEGIKLPVFVGGPVQADTLHFLHNWEQKYFFHKHGASRCSISLP